MKKIKTEKVVHSCEQNVLRIPSLLLVSTTLEPFFGDTLATVAMAVSTVARQQKFLIKYMDHLLYSILIFFKYKTMKISACQPPSSHQKNARQHAQPIHR